MKTISLRKGYFAGLISVVMIIGAVTGLFMFYLYRIYSNLIYSESAEVLKLYSIIANSRLSDMENLSFEFLANQDIQNNLLKYINSADLYQAYQATNDLYTQLFTRWIMNDGVVSISFVFLDGKRVDAGRLHEANVSNVTVKELLNLALLSEGACAWVVNAAGENTATLYRLIRDISGNNRFQPLGMLVINISADHFLNHTPVLSEKYKPDIICIADEQVLYGSEIAVQPREILQAVNDDAPRYRAKLNGESYFMLSTSLGKMGWNLIYLLSTKELLSSIKHANTIYGITLVIIVMVIAVVVYGLANAINKPLTRLTKAMKVVEDGNYSVRLNSSTLGSRFAITEVAQLTRGFSRMVGEIDCLINKVFSNQLMITDMKYKMLRQQINPHFLYNTLDTVNWKAVQSGNTDIAVMVKSLSNLLRSSIKGPDIITIGEDLSLVEDYIKIQKVRFEERLIFQADIPESVHSCPIPRLTLQTIVENCIVHNLEKYAKPCKISIDSVVVNGSLEIYIADDGRGVDLEYVEKVLTKQVETTGESVGLRNIDQRIKISFGETYGIRIANRKPTGTIVTIVLPCEGEYCDNTADC